MLEPNTNPFVMNPITYTPEQADPTFFSIMRKKYPHDVGRIGLPTDTHRLWIYLLAVVLCSLLVFQEHASATLGIIFSFYGYTIPKCIFGITIVIVIRNRKLLLKELRNHHKSNQDTIERQSFCITSSSVMGYP